MHKRVTPERIELIRSLRRAGLTLRSISRIVGTSFTTVQTYCEGINVTGELPSGLPPEIKQRLLAELQYARRSRRTKVTEDALDAVRKGKMTVVEAAEACGSTRYAIYKALK